MDSKSDNQHNDPGSLAAGCLMIPLQLLGALISTVFQILWILLTTLIALPLGIAAVLFILLLFFFM